MGLFELLKVETDFGITFQAAGLRHANRAPVMGREYYYPPEVPVAVLRVFKEHAAELTGLGVKEVLFRFETKTSNTNGLMNMVFEAELGPQWENGLVSREDASGSRARIAQLFAQIKKGLWDSEKRTFETVLEAPNKALPYGYEHAQETWHARLWCESAEFSAAQKS